MIPRRARHERVEPLPRLRHGDKRECANQSLSRFFRGRPSRLEHLPARFLTDRGWAKRSSAAISPKGGCSVHSIDRLKLWGFVLLPSRKHSHGLAAVGAMSICVAIVLNAGPFAKPPNAGLPVASAGQAVLAVMGKMNGPTLMATEEVAARNPQVFELVAQQSVPE